MQSANWIGRNFYHKIFRNSIDKHEHLIIVGIITNRRMFDL